MKNVYAFLLLFLLSGMGVFAQVSINSDNSVPDNSAMLDVKSTNMGFLPPRMTQSDRNAIASPATGLMIFQTDITPGYYYYNGTAWTALAAGHYVGELYGGGVVFWVDHTGQHGLICGMIDLSLNQAWSNVSSTLIGATAQNEWDGLGNSNAIVGQAGHISSAAKLCLDYVNADYGTGLYNDWYLPARGELNHLWNNIYEVQKALDSDGNPATTSILKTYYWSSSEYSSNSAWGFYFSNGNAASNFKYSNYLVRSVRTF